MTHLARSFVICAGLALLLSGCSKQRIIDIWEIPESQTQEELLARGQQDWVALNGEWPLPVPGPALDLTAQGAVLLAMQRSWDVKQAEMAVDLAKGQRLRANYDRLPPLSLSLSERLEESRSETGSQVIWQTDQTRSGNLLLTLDLIRLATGALAYRQEVNQTFIKQEILRQAKLELAQAVVQRFWSAALGQEQAQELASAMDILDDLRAKTRQARHSLLIDPLQSIGDEQNLLELAKKVQSNLAKQSSDQLALKQVLVAPPGARLRLYAFGRPNIIERPLTGSDIEALAQAALFNRSELLVQDYEIRNAILAGQVDIWSILGNLNLTSSLSILQTATVTRQAYATALGLTDDLTKLISARLRFGQANRDEQAAILERQLLAAGVVAEVLLAAHAYNVALDALALEEQVVALAQEKARLLAFQVQEGESKPAALPEAEVLAALARKTRNDQWITLLEARLELAAALGLSAERALDIQLSQQVASAKSMIAASRSLAAKPPELR